MRNFTKFHIKKIKSKSLVRDWCSFQHMLDRVLFPFGYMETMSSVTLKLPEFAYI